MNKLPLHRTWLIGFCAAAGLHGADPQPAPAQTQREVGISIQSPSAGLLPPPFELAFELWRFQQQARREDEVCGPSTGALYVQTFWNAPGYETRLVDVPRGHLAACFSIAALQGAVELEIIRVESASRDKIAGGLQGDEVLAVPTLLRAGRVNGAFALSGMARLWRWHSDPIADGDSFDPVVEIAAAAGGAGVEGGVGIAVDGDYTLALPAGTYRIRMASGSPEAAITLRYVNRLEAYAWVDGR